MKPGRHPHDECPHDEEIECVQRIGKLADAGTQCGQIFHRNLLIEWVTGLNGIGAGLAGAYADGLAEVGDEDLAVADLAGPGRLDDCLDDLFRNGFVDGEFDLGFRQKINDVLGPAVELRVAALAARSPSPRLP